MLARESVPEVYVTVVATRIGDDPASVWRPTQSTEETKVFVEKPAMACLHFPQSNGVSVSSGSQGPLIGRERQTPNPATVAREGPDLLLRDGIPHNQ